MEKEGNVSDMIQITNNTIEMGKDVLNQLNHQREQIDNMNNHIHNINNNISISRNVLNKMESLSYRVKSYLFGNKVTISNHICNSQDINKLDNYDSNFPETDDVNILRNNLKNLKNIGLSINAELDEQTELLVNMDNKVYNSNQNLNTLNKRINNF